MIAHEYTVLIIDDSAEDRLAYRRYLSKEFAADYKIIEAETGTEGLDLLIKFQPNLILLDYQLPDCNGLEFIADLKAEVNEIPPIIMLTGQGNEVIAVEAMKSGVQDYLIKGQLTTQSLTNVVKNVLQQHNLRTLLTKNLQQQRLIAETALRIRQSLDLSDILSTAVKEVRLLLACERVVIYQFEPDLSGNVVAESVAPGWTKSLGLNIVDTCFKEGGISRYLRGETLAVNNIHEYGFGKCHIQLLEQFEVEAHIICPLLLSNPTQQKPKVWGLLIAHQCVSPRNWKKDEIALLDKLAVQMAIAIQQVKLIDTLQTELVTRKRAEKSLQEKATELEWSNKELLKTTSIVKKRNQELDRFAYITSHDLKAPLRAIANLAAWLREDLSGEIPEENQQQLDLMHSRVKRMDSLIQGLLEYSRVGKKSFPLQLVNVGELLREIIDSLSPLPGFEMIIVGAMPTFKTEEVLLRQVFANLIDNALKYHPRQQGVITISVEERPESYLFGVADDGLGIDPQYHQRIFTIFQTLQARDTIESTGIGLSIVKKIVEAQGSQIWVESQVDEGSTFYFSWCKEKPVAANLSY